MNSTERFLFKLFRKAVEVVGRHSPPAAMIVKENIPSVCKTSRAVNSLEDVACLIGGNARLLISIVFLDKG